MSRGLQKIHSPELEKTKHFFRLTFLTGVRRGQSFTIKNDQRKIIGRDPKCDIPLNDSKTSRNHAELVWLNGELMVTDLKSQNGIIVNDKKVIQEKLRKYDRLIVGHTIFRIDIEYEADVGLTHYDSSLNKGITSIKSNTKKKSIIPLVAGTLILVVGFLILTEEGSEPEIVVKTRKKVTRKISNQQSLSKKINIETRSLNKKIDSKVLSLIQQGRRELREGNYFRALSEFNAALDENPSDSQAKFYKKKAYEGIESLVTQYNIEAQRNLATVNAERALVSYCAIIRLLQEYPKNVRYVQAMKNIKKIEKEQGYELGEVRCLQD